MDAWINSSEALSLLNVRAQTLYANVSRGKIRTKRDPEDTRKRLYHAGDVARLGSRRRGQRRIEDMMAEVTGWGHPIMVTSISTVHKGVLLYRDRNAVELSRSWSLEQVASLLWQTSEFCLDKPRFGSAERVFYSVCPVEKAMQTVAAKMHIESPTHERSSEDLMTDAHALLSRIIFTAFGDSSSHTLGTISEIASRYWTRPAAEPVLRQALCLLADHELNASTFATRVVISTGASLCSGILAGLAALNGPLHGRVGLTINALIKEAKSSGAELTVRKWLAEKQSIPAFGHPLYPEGDVRAKALLQNIPLSGVMSEICFWATQLTGEQPTVDFALACMVEEYDLPVDAPLSLYIAARTVGWIAHALEQAQEGSLIRPRAKYK
ncbi:citrate synthase [Pseudomonas cichorii]|nr:citrate synthase [Pseudomonas cichorii]MBX8491810.1 citrate synthase [Pseudomonas cichorii]MBX8512473.1 citrate synthase [Pseudomonas cichorii]MBX8522916.1 citrate synthase [Pseudomonas cichorii]MBX8527392.1 citrate synthase [Pseudomonas cichorii]MBX8538058.1 citrate synthase [Pseudomonas cichorii]